MSCTRASRDRTSTPRGRPRGAAPPPGKSDEDGCELRAGRGAREGETERTQVAAHCLELAEGRTCLVTGHPVRRSHTQLREALERRARFEWECHHRRLEHETGVLARLDEGARAAAERGSDLDRRTCGRGKLAVAHRRDGVDREAAQPREVEPDVVLR